MNKFSKLTGKASTAFTLAEILITLGIIGTVAALTIPVLIKNFQNIALGSQYKKMKSVLSNAVISAAYDNGNSINGVNLSNVIGKYMKLGENCNVTHTSNCWTPVGENRRKEKDGTYVPLDSTTRNYGLKLIDGAYISLGSGTLSCTTSPTTANPADTTSCSPAVYDSGLCTTIAIDINGSKKPNIYGQDIRQAYLWANGKVTWYGDSQMGITWVRNANIDNSEYQLGGKCYDTHNYTQTQYD